ncbi:MAG: hypothetical protein IH991_15435 [Planctomycetes bacterium]|nr:hypothetical protein [Planctomycetota bacterium]
MKYFKLAMTNDERWTLAIDRVFASGESVDIWAYSLGKVANANCSVPFHQDVEGESVDFNPTAFGSIVVSTKMANVLAEFASSDIQRIPAQVQGVQGDWEVLNVLSVVDCIDHELSKIQYFPDDHPEKPEKPRGIMKLVLDSGKASGRHVFKLKDWLVATVVSEDVKVALEDAGITGVEFWPATERQKKSISANLKG